MVRKLEKSDLDVIICGAVYVCKSVAFLSVCRIITNNYACLINYHVFTFFLEVNRMAEPGSSGAEGGSDKFASNKELLTHYTNQVTDIFTSQ